MRNSNSLAIATAVCGTFLLFAVLGGVFTLAWHGTFSGAETFGIVMSVIGIASGAFAVHTGIAAGKSVTPTIVHNHMPPMS